MDTAPSSRLPPTIGRYRILKELGRGMMGVVYLAEDPALDRLIALKTIDLAFAVPEAERAAFEQRFLAEARVAARLQHPGIVVVHDVGRDDAQGILYIALEYLQGRTLAEVTGQGRTLDWREALRIVAAVARALHHAHAQEVVHRDVKPANVMLLASGQPKIMDFGIAKVPHLELTSAGQFFGTPLYMSPEQASGGAVDGRSDLFSLGAVAYQILTGRQAFTAENVLQVLRRVVNEEPPAPSLVAPGVPPEVDLILGRAMAKDPAQRYAAGEDMAADIDALLAGRPPAAVDELPVLELDEEPLAAVLDHAPAATLTTRAARPAPALPSLAEPIPIPMRWEPPRGRRSWLRRHSVWIAAAAGALLLVLAVRSLRPAHPSAARGPAAAAPARIAEKQPVPDPASPTQPAEGQAAQDAPAGEGESRLEVDFEHHLRSGRIQVWVDDDQVLDEQLDSRITRKILSLRLRKGELQQVLAVPAGRHEVRVRLQWSDKVRSRRITGTFEPGKMRTLQVRVSRIFNDLSLDWD